jgi:deoxyribonuclease-4
MEQKYLGAHVPVIGGIYNTPRTAESIGARAFGLFLKNQRQWRGKPLTEKDIAAFRGNLEKSSILRENVLPHNGYLINVGHPDPEKREKSLASLTDEAVRASRLGLVQLNFHPGSSLGLISDEECLELTARGMDEVFAAVPDVALIIETTAGQGSSVGWKFEHIARIISASTVPERIGVCIDTCHIFAAGYDLRTRKSYEETMEKFARAVGFGKLLGVHLNDAKSDFGSRIDRHESIGKGRLGLAAFGFLMKDPRFDGMPILLETPNHNLWAEELLLLKKLEEE